MFLIAKRIFMIIYLLSKLMDFIIQYNDEPEHKTKDKLLNYILFTIRKG